MMEAAIAAAMAAMQSMELNKKKPELPTFDAKNIDIWIKRVESAYARANITKAKDKFAFLESKIGVDQDPKINEFLFGEATDEKWTSFLAYLRSRYGRTVKQECSSIIAGFSRDGRRPSEMLAHIRDRAGRVTMDDLFKEIVLQSLPTEIQRSIADKTDSLDAEAAVKLADVFFDKDGLPIHASTSSVNNVEQGEEVEQDEEETVNFVNRGRNIKKPHFQARKPSENWRSRSSRPSPSQQPPKNQRTFTCKAHQLYGDEAWSCEKGCRRNGQPLAKRPPKEQAGRRS